MRWALCLLWLTALGQESPRPERPEKEPPPTVSLFGEQFIRSADAIAIGRTVSVSRLNARSVFVARFEVDEHLKGEHDEDSGPLLLIAHTPEAFSVSPAKRLLFARRYRPRSRFYLAEGQFSETDPRWKEKLLQLRFLIELEESDEPLEKRRQKLLERLLEQADRAPEWTRNNGLRELEFLAERSPELFGLAERKRLRELVESEKDRGRLRALRGVLQRLDRPRATDDRRSGVPFRRRKRG